MNLLRKILIPFVPVYYLVTWFRNFFYDKGLLESKAYNLPIICVGNLNVGGTGKTPMIEFLIRLLQDQYKVAVLSRGYKRKSKGFILAQENT
ncbi:MAG: tetraacyldisaccharide 4'-kinase, partial [Flavobacteriaceae bacterium]|nr:tetraacyldisaccharide 4'-kinase [Flavobacteriaceae bacterium]